MKPMSAQWCSPMTSRTSIFFVDGPLAGGVMTVRVAGSCYKTAVFKSKNRIGYYAAKDAYPKREGDVEPPAKLREYVAARWVDVEPK